MNFLLFYGILSIKMLIDQETSDYKIKYCFTTNCSVESFNGTFKNDCLLKNNNVEFQVISILEDRNYYQILYKELSYWINVDCVSNVTEMLPFSYPIELDSFKKSEIVDIIQADSSSMSNLNKEDNDRNLLSNDTNIDEIITPQDISNTNTNTTPTITSSFEKELQEILHTDTITEDIKSTEDIKTTEYVFNASDNKDSNIVDEFPLLSEINNNDSSNWFIKYILEPKINSTYYINVISKYTSIYINYLLEPINIKILHSNLHVFITIFLIFILFFRISSNKFSNYYQLHESKLKKFYEQNINILQENKIKFEQLYLDSLKNIEIKDSVYNSHIKECQISATLDKEIKNELDEFKSKCLALQSELATFKSIELKYKELTLKHDEDKDSLNKLSAKFTHLEVELKSKTSSLHDYELKNRELELTNKIQAKSVQILTSDNHELRQKNTDSLNKLTTIYALFSGLNTKYNVSNDVSTFPDVLTKIGDNDIVEYFEQINTKLQAFEEMESKQGTLISLQRENKNLSEKILKLEMKNTELESNMSRIKEENLVLDTEIKIMKKHYYETEWNLHEKYNQERQKVEEIQKKMSSINDESKYIPELKTTILELKQQIFTAEQTTKKLKEDNAMESNNNFIIIKKIERELERVNVEKENYRIKLLKVLEDNQKVQNEKTAIEVNHNKPLVSSRVNKDTTHSSQRSISPVRSSYYKNKIGSPSYPPPPPPPPPPMPMHMPMRMSMPFSPDVYNYPRNSSPIVDLFDNNMVQMTNLNKNNASSNNINNRNDTCETFDPSRINNLNI